MMECGQQAYQTITPLLKADLLSTIFIDSEKCFRKQCVFSGFNYVQCDCEPQKG